MKNVMVVDDSPSMRMLVTFALEDAGYEVTQASNGNEAYLKAKEMSAEAVITDLNMESMDGISLIRELRMLPEYRHTPIVMLTTESQDEKIKDAKRAGASAWITKPFKPTQLVSTVKKLVR